MAAANLKYAMPGDIADVESLMSNVLRFSTEYSIIGKDLEGNIVLWNEGARRIYGYEVEEIVGTANAAILHPPEDVLSCKPQEIMATTLREGKWEGTVGRVRKNGERFTARVVMTPRHDASGEVIGFLLISKDISEEMRLTEEVKAVQFYTRSLIESSIDAMITTNPLGIITDVNQQMEALSGVGREELMGSPFKQYFTDPESAEQGIRLVLREGRVNDYELVARAKDGRETAVSFNAANFYDCAGRLEGVFVAARDVTERKVFERTLQEKNLELERASLAKDRFLASMSHELRTPLNAILGFTGTLLMKLPGPLNADQEKQLTIVKASAKHLLSLINDLLDLARIQSGEAEIRVEAVPYRSVVEEVVAALQPLAQSKGLVFKVQMPGGELTVQADRRALHQILLNLTNNAIKFTERGNIFLDVERSQTDGSGQTIFRIRDTGIGICPEDQARLFLPFSQIRGSRHQEAEGSGLGLHLSRSLAVLMGGHILCESEYGKGSAFTLVLKDR